MDTRAKVSIIITILGVLLIIALTVCEGNLFLCLTVASGG